MIGRRFLGNKIEDLVEKRVKLGIEARTSMQLSDPKVKVVAQDIQLYEVNPSKLTSDCMVVIRMDGIVDIVRAYKMVDVFDFYYDLNVPLKKIQLSGGVLNPKTQSPCL